MGCEKPDLSVSGFGLESNPLYNGPYIFSVFETSETPIDVLEKCLITSISIENFNNQESNNNINKVIKSKQIEFSYTISHAGNYILKISMISLSDRTKIVLPPLTEKLFLLKFTLPACYIFGIKSPETFVALGAQLEFKVHVLYENICDEMFELFCFYEKNISIKLENSSDAKIESFYIDKSFGKRQIIVKACYKVLACSRGKHDMEILLFGAVVKKVVLVVGSLLKDCSIDFCSKKKDLLKKYKDSAVKNSRIVDFEFKKLLKENYDFLYTENIPLNKIIMRESEIMINGKFLDCEGLIENAQKKADDVIEKVILMNFGCVEKEKLFYLENLMGKKPSGIWRIDKFCLFLKEQKNKAIKVISLISEEENVNFESAEYISILKTIEMNMQITKSLLGLTKEEFLKYTRGDYGFWDYDLCFQFILDNKRKIYSGLVLLYPDFWTTNTGKNSKNWKFNKLFRFYCSVTEHFFDILSLFVSDSETESMRNVKSSPFMNCEIMTKLADKVSLRCVDDLKRIYNLEEIKTKLKCINDDVDACNLYNIQEGETEKMKKCSDEFRDLLQRKNWDDILQLHRDTGNLIYEEIVKFNKNFSKKGDLSKANYSKNSNRNLVVWDFTKLLEETNNFKNEYTKKIKILFTDNSFEKTNKMFCFDELGNKVKDRIKEINKYLGKFGITLDEKHQIEKLEISNITMNNQFAEFINEVNAKFEKLVQRLKKNPRISDADINAFYFEKNKNFKFDLKKMFDFVKSKNLIPIFSTHDMNKKKSKAEKLERIIISSETDLEKMQQRELVFPLRLTIIALSQSTNWDYFCEFLTNPRYENQTSNSYRSGDFLEKLELRKTRLTCEGAEKLCGVLVKSMSLIEFSLVEDYSVHSDGWKAISRLIAQSESLQHLKLWVPSHSAEFAIEQITKGVAQCRKLRKLKLVVNKYYSERVFELEKTCEDKKVVFLIDRSCL